MNLPDGWLTEAEAAQLQELVRGKMVLELGAWKGRSTVAMAATALYVVSVDKHMGIAEVGGEDSLPDYLAAVRGLSNVGIVVADWDDFLVLDDVFDVVFVDGNHDEESAARDTQTALEHVSLQGLMVFHDWDFETVRSGVTAILGDRDPAGLVGSLAWFEVLP